MIERIGILDKVINKVEEFKVNYIETNVQEIINLSSNYNYLSAMILANTLISAIERDNQIFQEINTIIEYIERSEFDNQER